VEIVRWGFEEFFKRRALIPEITAPEFVWDMSHFHGWPEQQVYEGIQGAEQFLAAWTSAWDDWQLELDSLHDANDRVVAVLRQHGRSTLTGISVDMALAMVWTLRDGKETRMEMYSEIGEALKAVGLEE
jgi:ketosteroid isomerase-like protein